METESGGVLRTIAFLPSNVDFNPAPQLSPVIMVVGVAKGRSKVFFSYPTNWCLASWRGQYGNQSLESIPLGPNLEFQGTKFVPDSDVNWVEGEKIYSTYDPIAAGLLFDRFVAEPEVLWTELERLLECRA